MKRARHGSDYDQPFLTIVCATDREIASLQLKFFELAAIRHPPASKTPLREMLALLGDTLIAVRIWATDEVDACEEKAG